MFDINQIYKVDDFLNDEEVAGLNHYAEHYFWTFNGRSIPGSPLFWKKDMWQSKWGKCTQIETTFREKVDTIFDIKTETLSLYLNGQSHGQCGSIHSDVNEAELDYDPYADYITLVYYANEQWTPEYGGFTVIIDRDENIHVNYPKPNSVIIFNSRLPHVGLEPTRHCNGMRVTLAHKMKILKE